MIHRRILNSTEPREYWHSAPSDNVAPSTFDTMYHTSWHNIVCSFNLDSSILLASWDASLSTLFWQWITNTILAFSEVNWWTTAVHVAGGLCNSMKAQSELLFCRSPLWWYLYWIVVIYESMRCSRNLWCKSRTRQQKCGKSLQLTRADTLRRKKQIYTPLTWRCTKEDLKYFLLTIPLFPWCLSKIMTLYTCSPGDERDTYHSVTCLQSVFLTNRAISFTWCHKLHTPSWQRPVVLKEKKFVAFRILPFTAYSCTETYSTAYSRIETNFTADRAQW